MGWLNILGMDKYYHCEDIKNEIQWYIDYIPDYQ